MQRDSRVFAEQDPKAFVEQAAGRLLVIDEIQRVPSLTLAVKASVEQNRTPGRFILTGSSDLARLRGDKDSLAGRTVNLGLFPFTQAELRATTARGTLVDPILDATEPREATTPQTPLTHDDLIQLLLPGGLPAVQGMTTRVRAAWYRTYVEKLIRVDALEDGGRLSPERLASLLRLLAANQAGEVIKARIGQEAEIPGPSVQRYLDALTRLHLVHEIRPWTPNLTSRETGRRKVAVVDTGLAAWLCGATASSLAVAPDGLQLLGALTEGMVTTELLAQREWAEHHYDVYHYRDRNGKEIDHILELEDGRVVAIEVKASRTIQPGHFKCLGFLRDRLGDRLAGAVVLAAIDAPLSVGRGLWALPLSALWA